MKKPIYLDYAATTPVDPRVANKMQGYLTMDHCFGNPASNTHVYGMQAHEAIEYAREQVADLINADSKEIIWTSGATESDNLAIIGVANFYKNKGKHIITAKTEHKAVLDTCLYLQGQGFDITFLEPEKNGIIDLEKFKAAIRSDTILASIMHVNNEIGVIQDIEGLGSICRKHHIYFHVDAAQSAGKLPLDVANLPVDLMSFSSHKVYGPKGIGALYVRQKPRVRLDALIHGGGHEKGMRSGTLPTHQVVGMGEAFAIAKETLILESKHILYLRNKLWEGISDLPDIYLNGDWVQRAPGNLNVSFAGVDGTALLYAVNDLAVSTGSACTSATIEASYVLKSLGVSDALAHSALRISIGRFTTEQEIDYAILHIREGVNWLRSLSPLWKSEL